MQTVFSNVPETSSKATTQTSVFITQPVIIYPHTWLRKEIPSTVGVERSCRREDVSSVDTFLGCKNQFLTPFQASWDSSKPRETSITHRVKFQIIRSQM